MHRLYLVYIPHTIPTTFLCTGCTQCTYHIHFPPHFYLQVVPSVHTTYISHNISIYRLYPVYIPIPQNCFQKQTLPTSHCQTHLSHSTKSDGTEWSRFLEPADLALPWEGACSACPCWCAGEWAGTGRLWMLRGSWWGWWSAWDDTKCWPNGTDTCRTQHKNQNTHVRS